MSFAAMAVVSLPVMAMITGIYVFGWARLRLPDDRHGRCPTAPP